MKEPEKPPWYTPSFGVQINFLLGLGAALLVAVGSLAHRSLGELVETGRIESETPASLARIEVAAGSIRGAMAAQRTYLITRREADLAAYRAARERVRSELGGLGTRFADAQQARTMRELGAAFDARLRHLDQLEDAGRDGFAATSRLVAGPAAADLDRRIDELCEQLRERELRLLRTRRSDTDANAGVAAFLINWGMALACALLLWAMASLHRHQAGRRAAERAVRASEAQLRLITDSVPALIGYADRSGKLLFHNRGLQSWFGDDAGTLRGGTVRELLGEESYRAVEPRVGSVLKGEPADFVFSLRTAAGEDRELSAQLVPRRDDARGVIGYYALFTDVTALKQVERMKAEFIATISHELRTPLTSIRGSLGLVAGGVTGVLPDKARELLGIAVQNCERLVRLVNDILDSERMMSGKMSFQIEPLGLCEIVERSIRETDAFAAARGVRLVFEPPREDPRIRGDHDRLVQVLTNLLSNASKFSPQGSAVEVAIECAGDEARVSVSDRGPGVPPAAEARLFQRFMQADSSDVRRVGGTGLGLSICKAIVERLHGRIAYAPRAGGGSTFYFELPVLQPQARAAG